MSGSVEHILETMVVPELKRIADALEPLAKLVIEVTEERLEEERTRTVPARDVQRIPPATAPPRVPRPRANV